MQVKIQIRTLILSAILSSVFFNGEGQIFLSGGYQGGQYGQGGIENTTGLDNPKVDEQDRFVFFPNPFSNQSTIRYLLARPALVELFVCDLTGRKVRTLVQPTESAPGQFTVTWDGKDDRGNQLAKGIYFYRFFSEDTVKTSKVILLR